MVEAVQDVMADFMPRKADSSMREGQATPRLTSPWSGCTDLTLADDDGFPHRAMW